MVVSVPEEQSVAELRASVQAFDDERNSNRSDAPAHHDPENFRRAFRRDE